MHFLMHGLWLSNGHAFDIPPFVLRDTDGSVIAEYPYTGEKYVEYDFFIGNPKAGTVEHANAEKAYWQYCRTYLA